MKQNWIQEVLTKLANEKSYLFCSILAQINDLC